MMVTGLFMSAMPPFKRNRRCDVRTWVQAPSTGL